MFAARVLAAKVTFSHPWQFDDVALLLIINMLQGKYSEISRKKVESLTERDILDTINNKNVSQIFLKDFNFKELLGDIKYDNKGNIIGGFQWRKTKLSPTIPLSGAGAVEVKFFTTVNVTAVKLFGTATRGEKIDHQGFAFEGKMIKLFMERDTFPDGLSSYVNIQRQFFDSFVGQTFKDADKLVMGYMLVFVYVNVMLSKLNCVEQRFWLSVIGILRWAKNLYSP